MQVVDYFADAETDRQGFDGLSSWARSPPAAQCISPCFGWVSLEDENTQQLA